jgi:GUN4-like/TIR domain
MSDTIEIFISYSKQDKELRDGLLAHLRPLETKGIITWHDRQILPGTEWDDEIKARLNAADIILLLISADFLATKYCAEVEIPEALRRHAAREATVMPVILRHCAWEYTSLSAIQAYPEKAKPIVSWKYIDEAYTDVVTGVYLAATEIKKRRRQQQQIVSSALASEPPPIRLEVAETLPRVPLKNLQTCDPSKILFIKNVKHPDPNAWAYPLEQMRQPESRTFELMWRKNSHGVTQPKAKDLMILHQRAKVTHIVDFLDDQVRQTDIGFFRWVRAVWIAEKDWSLLPHQKHILGFSPNYADGNTHSLKSLGFSTFRKTWSNLEEFQQHIVKRLTRPEVSVTDEDELTSEKGVDYTRLWDLLKAGQWEKADRETVVCMCAVMERQEEGWLRVEDIEQFPCADLRAIDQLWVNHSEGRFGFSVQKQIWQECGSPTEYDAEWEKFGDRVGWREGLTVEWRLRGELTFNTSAPKGHLPSPPYLWGDLIIDDLWGVTIDDNATLGDPALAREISIVFARTDF